MQSFKKKKQWTNKLDRSILKLFVFVFFNQKKKHKNKQFKIASTNKRTILKKNEIFFEQLKKEQNGSDEERLTSVIVKKQICNENVYVMYIKSLNGN